MVKDCLRVQVGVMAAGEVLKIDVGEGVSNGMQVDDVADYEAVMPGACLQAHGVIKRQCPHACSRGYLDRYPPWLQCLLAKIHLHLIAGTRKPKHQARVTAPRPRQAARRTPPTGSASPPTLRA